MNTHAEPACNVLVASQRPEGRMYDVSEHLPVAELRPGTNLLVTGPPTSGKYELLCDLLASGVDAGDASLVVTTSNTANQVEEDVTMRCPVEPDLAVVDCVSKERRVKTPGRPRVEYVDTPGDFTSIGMAASRYLEEFETRRDRTRFALDSLSTLLLHADVKTVFRFAHILTGRITATDAVGFFTLDAEAHDQRTNNTIRQLFDGLVETRTGVDGRELRAVGLTDAPTDWEPF